MTRKSTRKKARVSYAEIAGEKPEPGPSTSKPKRKRKDDSDFEHENEAGEEDEDEVDSIEESPPSSPPTPVSNSESDLEPDTQQSANTSRKSIPSATSRIPRRSSIREMNSRARPCPAFFPDPAVRLVSASADLFEKQEIKRVRGKRDAKSTRGFRDYLGMNVGAGPTVGLSEDLGWYKEKGEGEKRPRVYQDVKVREVDLEDVQESEVESYLTCTQPLLSQQNTTCLMGPFNEQKPITLNRFETHEYWPSSRALVFQAGNPVWALSWCANSEEFATQHDYAQYLAVSTIPASPPPVPFQPPPPAPDQFTKSAIQIWRFGPKSVEDRSPSLSCALVICFDAQPARMVKWSPLPTDDGDKPADEGERRKLGILAGLFGDGSVRLYAIPEPVPDASEPIYIRLARPLVHLTLPDTRFTCFDWANSEIMGLGCSNGHIAIYNLKPAIQGAPSNLPLLPTHYIPAHQSRVSSIAWVRIPPSSTAINENPTTVITGGFDGFVYVTDLRHSEISVALYRCRDVAQSVAFATYGAGVVSNEHENMVKFTGLQPIVLGRGHNVTEVRGPDIATSDLHPQIAVASSDGTLTITNLLKYVRKGSPMPSFVHTIYRMDYNYETKQLRMLDMFLPREYKDPRYLTKTRGLPQGVAPPNATPAQRIEAERERDGFGTWHRDVGIHCASWQPSRLAQAGVLASGGASGFVRIDVLRGLQFGSQKDDGAEDEDDD